MRAYGIGAEHGELGTESLHDCLAWARQASPCGQCYVCGMRQVASELWRVLRDDGTWFLNLGDSYAGSGVHAAHHANPGLSKAGQRQGAVATPVANGLKPKDLVGIPWRVALALQADGWVLRSEIIWAKPNAMPESVTDRPTKAHEQVFLLTKQGRYFWDHEAVREVAQTAERSREKNNGESAVDTKMRGHGGHCGTTIGRNARTVWTIPTESFSGAHYATFPQALVERCIKAGTSEAGCCAACGAPWVREVEHAGEWRAQHGRQGKHDGTVYRRNPGGGLKGPCTTTTYTLKDFAPSCACNAPARPCLVLDPFAGSGTVGLVARALGRHAVLCDLSYAYLHDQARPRLQLDALAAWEGARGRAVPALDVDDLPLFRQQEVAP